MAASAHDKRRCTRRNSMPRCCASLSPRAKVMADRRSSYPHRERLRGPTPRPCKPPHIVAPTYTEAADRCCDNASCRAHRIIATVRSRQLMAVMPRRMMYSNAPLHYITALTRCTRILFAPRRHDRSTRTADQHLEDALRYFSRNCERRASTIAGSLCGDEPRHGSAISACVAYGRLLRSGVVCALAQRLPSVSAPGRQSHSISAHLNRAALERKHGSCPVVAGCAADRLLANRERADVSGSLSARRGRHIYRLEPSATEPTPQICSPISRHPIDRAAADIDVIVVTAPYRPCERACPDTLHRPDPGSPHPSRPDDQIDASPPRSRPLATVRHVARSSHGVTAAIEAHRPTNW
jgi:hypothetical protein